MSTRSHTLSRAAIWVALLIAVLALPLVAFAANTVVTPANPNGWGPTDVRTDATVGITADQPRDGLGSLKFTTNTVTPGQDKADFTKTWTSATRTLGNLSDVSFEYYRASSSTTAAHLGPVLRLLWLQDNAPAGLGAEDNYGYLIWEQTYNGIGSVPTNAWQSQNLFSTGKFWMRLVSGPNTVPACNKTIQNFNVTLNDWLTANPQGIGGDCVAPDLDANTLIYGVNTGVGSGWGATFLGYVDSVVVAFGADVESANFEPNPACTTVCYADTVNGNNANGGASANDAKKTIQAAVTQVTAGGQVYVAAGTYVEDVTINKAVTVTGAGPATTIIDPVNYVGISADNVTIEDIAISAGTHGARLSKSGSPLANTTFDNVHFKNNTSRGIDIVNLLHVTNLQVLNCLFEGNPTGIRMPSNATADGITIDNTTFQNQTGSGFNQANDGSTGWVKNLTVTDSTFINLGTTSGHAGVYAEEFSNVLIEGSTFTGNRYGINLFDAYSVASSVTTNVVIRDNTFTDHKASAISFRSTTSDPNAQLLLVEDNTFTQNVSNYAAGSFAAVAVSTHATNGNGAVDVVNNTITLSGALPVGATTAHGIYVQGGMEDVRIEGNDVDGGGIANNGGTIPPTGVYIQSFSMKANAVVLVTKNELINFNNGVSVHNGSAFGGVTSPGFDVTRNDLSGNSGYGLQSGPTMVSDGTCNWWGDASGPSGQGIGSGTAVSTHVDFSTWLGSSDLNGACQAGATITVSKVTNPNTDTTTVFTFDPSWSATNFTLKNGENTVSGPLPADNYSVTEVSMPALWVLQSATCDNTATVPVETADPSNLTVAAGDTWACTFTNTLKPLCTTDCYADIVNGSDTLNGGTGPSDAFKTIQKAVDTVLVNGTVHVLPGTYAENVIVNKSVTINGANAGVSPNDPGTPLNPNGARGPESEVTVTGGAGAFRVGAANVTIDGFKFTDANVAQADVQSPIIGAGWNFGGDAPGIKILNNLFYQTNRMLVYFNGPVLMQGGTIEDNRAQNPGRPDTGCGTAPALAPTNCAHQLFNPWSTQNLSFQRNVTIATPGSGDRIRTLNISRSADSIIADNTVRYTCTYVCFNIASDVGGDVEMTGNDLVTDVGNVVQIHSTWTTLGANINVHHNILTTGADFPIVVDDVDADLDNVHINRNAVSSTMSPVLGMIPNARNGKDDLSVPGAETLDVSCNWWGNAAEPTGFFGPNDHTPWLYTANLDGPCYIGGTISIDKVAGGGGATQFTFDVSWSAANVTLTDASAPYVTNPPLQAGNYAITEINPPLGWSLQSATCDNATTTPVETVNPSSINVADGDEWLCTFTNVYTPPPTNTCAVPGTQYTDLLGLGMGNTKKHKAAATIKLPNYTNLVDLYGQMVAKVPGAAKYVRFVMPGKGNYVQVNAITAPSEHTFGNFWYGADIPWATTPPKQVKGQWFLQPSGTKGHIPRAFVLYATYQHATNRYVNVWDTFTPAEGEVYWDIAQGWTPSRQIVVPIPAPLGPTTFNVELALVDNDKDTRPVWVTVTAGNVSQTQQPTTPSNGEQLNLMTFALANVPAGTNQIVIDVYSPSPTIDGVNGDSATLVGMAANYLCASITTP